MLCLCRSSQPAHVLQVQAIGVDELLAGGGDGGCQQAVLFQEVRQGAHQGRQVPVLLGLPGGQSQELGFTDMAQVAETAFEQQLLQDGCLADAPADGLSGKAVIGEPAGEPVQQRAKQR